MREIGFANGIDDQSVIQYIIDGIDGDHSSKAMLYSAKTYDDLKIKLEDYERFKAADSKKSDDSNKSNINKKFNKDQSNSKQKPDQKEPRCFLCGDGHLAKVCPTKDKGSKCFRCNVFGHKSSDKVCKDSDIENKANNDKKISCLKSQGKSIKNVSICGIDFNALIDTGSDINAIRRSLFETLNIRSNVGPLEKFKAAAGAVLSAFEYFVAKVKIDNDVFQSLFYIVGENDIPTQVVIGNELLFNKSVEMSVKNGQMFIKHNENPIENLSIDNNVNCSSEINSMMCVLLSEKDENPL